MQPHEISAHRVIDALNVIHREWSTLTPEARMALLRAFNPSGAAIDTAATSLTEQHPFEPITDEEKQAVFENLCEASAELSTKDIAEMQVYDWNEWAWRCEYAQMCEECE